MYRIGHQWIQIKHFTLKKNIFYGLQKLFYTFVHIYYQTNRILKKRTKKNKTNQKKKCKVYRLH